MTASELEHLRSLEERVDEAKVRAELERDEYRKLVLLLQEQNEKLKRGLLSQKAERLPKNDAQLSLSILQLAMGELTSFEPTDEVLPEDEEQTIPEHQRRKGRKSLLEHLPRVTIEVLPPEVQSEGLDAFERIGQESRCVLERRPASSVVVELVYPKFVRRDRARGEATDVLVAPAVELPIERGLAGPGMLADTIVRRWQDHQPLTNHLKRNAALGESFKILGDVVKQKPAPTYVGKRLRLTSPRRVENLDALALQVLNARNKVEVAANQNTEIVCAFPSQAHHVSNYPCIDSLLGCLIKAAFAGRTIRKRLPASMTC